MLEARDICLTYEDGGSRARAVSDLSLTIKPGQFVGILGPSGSGKSSLLYLLSGLRRAESGDISFEGRSYEAMSDRERVELRRTKFGFVFQQHFLIDYLTAIENVMVASPARGKAGLEAAEGLLVSLGLEGKGNRFIHELSGGERQRVAIARAMIHRPSVVFADEPTGLLDRKTGLGAMDLLKACCRGGSLVAVTHNPEIVADADLVVIMEDGRIVDRENRPAPVGARGAS
jgi:putative ABC transport system ATP-binding protein